MKRLFGVLLVVLFVFASSKIAVSQTLAEIAEARSIARQKGYSDEEIDNLIGNRGKQSESSSSSSLVTQSDDFNRNDSVDTKSIMKDARRNYTKSDKSGIFGHELFENKNSSFFPSYNIPTPSNYKLAPGDEVVINIWGAVVKNIHSVISPEGAVNIPGFGPVYLNGIVISKAKSLLEKKLTQIYSGLSGENRNTYLDVTLGKMRSVTINITGEVKIPGSYTLPSLSTMETALYMAGGSTKLGTVRDIKLYRNNRLVLSFDLYDYLIAGKLNMNIRLEDNDIIVVGTYNNIVSVKGNVKRPMKYELKDGETIDDLVNYAGGFSRAAYTGNVNVIRTKGEMYSTFDVGKNEFPSFKLLDGDTVSVRSNLDRNKNLISITGAVCHPGKYALSERTLMLSDLIEKAGGLVEDAYTGRGIIYRKNELKEEEAVGFNVNDIIKGVNDISLQKSDKIVIKYSSQLRNYYTVSILGEVNNPTSVPYRKGMTVNDLIFIADSLTDAGQLSNIEVSRKIRDKEADKESSLEKRDTLSKVYYLDLLNYPSDGNFKLKPFDKVFVRRSPGYLPQESVKITGQVFYPGTYSLNKRIVRLSDIVELAQGFRKAAYIKGATLTRRSSKEEKEALRKAMEIDSERIDTLAKVSFDESELDGHYDIAINMQKAILKPGSNDDVILRDGDIINVPKQINTVKIDGAVLRPGVVTFNNKMSMNDYIEKAGGLTKYAWKKKIYMVSMNGNVYTKKSGKLKIEPGCRIVIPEKAPKRDRMSFGEAASIGTSVTSLATMLVYLISKL